MLRIIKIICLVCIIALLAGIFIMECCKDKVVKVDLQNDLIQTDLKENVFCEAQSISKIADSQRSLSVEIPPNAAITKIYVSVTQKPSAPIDGGVILVISPQSKVFFLHRFGKSLSASIGGFETTLVQPLCVGAEGAFFEFHTVKGNEVTAGEILSATIVYCPDYCIK